MATTGVDAVFVDTNVLVYANISTAPHHPAAFRKLHDLRAGGVELWISRPVLREYLALLTRPQTFVAPQPIATLATQVKIFEGLMRVAEDGPRITANLLNLMQAIPTGGKQVHDANIVATMLAYNIPKLLTHNAVDFARFASIITILPLA